ncbi:hypothetical protein PENTCL1PPCAC_4821, partial [Pristionchus entomophagus]
QEQERNLSTQPSASFPSSHVPPSSSSTCLPWMERKPSSDSSDSDRNDSDDDTETKKEQLEPSTQENVKEEETSAEFDKLARTMDDVTIDSPDGAGSTFMFVACSSQPNAPTPKSPRSQDTVINEDDVASEEQNDLDSAKDLSGTNKDEEEEEGKKGEEKEGDTETEEKEEGEITDDEEEEETDDDLANPALKCALHNCQGVEGKLNELEKYFVDNQLSIVGLTETWLGEGSECDLSFNGKYNVFECERELDKNNGWKPRGGTAILVDKSLKASFVEKYAFAYKGEMVACRVALTPFYTVLVVCVYRSGDCAFDNFKSCLNHIAAYAQSDISHLILMGDFNCNKIDWKSFWHTRSCSVNLEQNSKALLEFTLNNSLTQFVLEPTREQPAPRNTSIITKSVLDLVFSSDKNLISDCNVDSTQLISDCNVDSTQL